MSMSLFWLNHVGFDLLRLATEDAEEKVQSMPVIEFLHSGALFLCSLEAKKNPHLVFTVTFHTALPTFFQRTASSFSYLPHGHLPVYPPTQPAPLQTS
ncbi:hypothetical protein AMECASPLE_015628 [Ameca splendens]|uniref:Uncharacterized protein n=1 Tax=Ameca splendens TaxID=208324 RepID=A0ABV1A955_9TELE